MTNEEMQLLGELKGQMGMLLKGMENDREDRKQIYETLNEYGITIKSLCEWRQTCGDSQKAVTARQTALMAGGFSALFSLIATALKYLFHW